MLSVPMREEIIAIISSTIHNRFSSVSLAVQKLVAKIEYVPKVGLLEHAIMDVLIAPVVALFFFRLLVLMFNILEQLPGCNKVLLGGK